MFSVTEEGARRGGGEVTGWEHIASTLLLFHLYEISRKGESMAIECKIMASRDLGKKRMESNFLIGPRFPFGVMKIFLELDRIC